MMNRAYKYRLYPTTEQTDLTNGREVSLLLAYLAHEVRAQAEDESVAFD